MVPKLNRSALCIAAGRGLCVAGAGVAEGGLDGAPAAAPPRLQRSAAQCAVPAPAQRLHEPSPGGRVHTAGGALSGAAASGFARGGGALRSLAQAPAREGGLLRGMAPWRMASWDLGSAAVAQRLAGRRFQVLSTMTHGNDDDKPSVSRIAAGTLHQSIPIQRRRIGDTQAPSAQNLNPGSHKPDPRLGRPVIRKRPHPSARGAPGRRVTANTGLVDLPRRLNRDLTSANSATAVLSIIRRSRKNFDTINMSTAMIRLAVTAQGFPEIIEQVAFCEELKLLRQDMQARISDFGLGEHDVGVCNIRNPAWLPPEKQSGKEDRGHIRSVCDQPDRMFCNTICVLALLPEK
ncbi:hypothetical protein CYMTET_11349 [Cymbomonas tetramitiformis]|uniref:Uncharacterized protein n=1 Tax=Cymbomonas tetramitiformis TaxID=36881 RepID=A0AAE0LD93_9CHLO|nr:hypothetical protein CYMTET_11349 [Cymbomonas tetramitiformis]